MKKTLITLMALTGMAMGAEQLWTIDMTKATNDASRITVEEGAYYNSNYWSNGSISSLGTTVTSDQKIALNDQGGDLGFRLKDEFSLTLNAVIDSPVSTQTSNHSAISVLMQVGEGNDWNFKIGVDSNNQFVFTTNGYELIQGDTSNNGYLTSGAHTFTLTFGNASTIDESGRPDGEMNFYVDGILSATAKIDGNNRPGDATMNTLIVGNIIQEHAGIAGTYSSITAYSGVVSIPEPATATLSLLALAGLASRRRRK